MKTAVSVASTVGPDRPTGRSPRRALALSLAALLLGACGQKGALYLPPAATPDRAGPRSAPAPAASATVPPSDLPTAPPG